VHSDDYAWFDGGSEDDDGDELDEIGDDDDDDAANPKRRGDTGAEEEEAEDDTSIPAMMKCLAAEEENGVFRVPSGEYDSAARRAVESAARTKAICMNTAMCGCKGHTVRGGAADGEVVAIAYSRVVSDAHGCYIQIDPSSLAPGIVARRTGTTKIAEEYAWIPCIIGTATKAFYAGDRLPAPGPSAPASRPDPSPRPAAPDAKQGATVLDTKRTALDDLDAKLAKEATDATRGASVAGDAARVPDKHAKQRPISTFFRAPGTTPAVAHTGDAPKAAVSSSSSVKLKKKHSGFSRNCYYVRVADIVVEKRTS
jgi:hypothetical protein